MRASLGGTKAKLRPEGKYELVGILHHSGDTQRSGHYFFSGARDARGWYKYNDLEVSPVGIEYFEDERVQQTAYGLLYRFIN
jgi:ubiquitin C-terminal hydrolase